MTSTDSLIMTTHGVGPGAVTTERQARSCRSAHSRRAGRSAERWTIRISRRRPDGHWCAELESNCSITAEYVLHAPRARVSGSEPARKATVWCGYLCSHHQAEDGSWGDRATGMPGDRFDDGGVPTWRCGSSALRPPTTACC